MMSSPSGRHGEQSAEDTAQMNYRQILGGLMETRGEMRVRKPQPEVVVKLQLAEGEEDVVRGLLGNPNLEFKVVAVTTSDGITIELRVRVKHAPAAESMPKH